MINDYKNISWDKFYEVLELYRNKFLLGIPAEEKYYIEIFNKINELKIIDKSKYIDSILLFLNRWKCRFSRKTSPGAMTKWIKDNNNNLEDLCIYSIIDIKLPELAQSIDILFDSLIELKYQGIHNMSDACASKIMHLMVPKLFVMWDANIKPYKSYPYSNFLEEMQKFANFIIMEFLRKYKDEDIEEYLQNSLYYPIKKPLAKYIDEFNWYLAFGYSRIQY
jgi:hypothetical protein